jgi:hypothetical protein
MLHRLDERADHLREGDEAEPPLRTSARTMCPRESSASISARPM